MKGRNDSEQMSRAKREKNVVASSVCVDLLLFLLLLVASLIEVRGVNERLGGR